ncbi:malonate--CoA ligase [Aquisediminimonas sediminicola]|uniref:malonate--CoA ligase n=1 Tax=Alteraquisediminimonas sediminicola TaxID=2676787 RepID=UPI001C8DCFBE|nr:malonyl-CoA synthase [Aquisediminimonas sediminicola]
MTTYTDIIDTICTLADADPARPFLRNAAGDILLDYGQLRSESARIAALLAELGIQPGDRVTAQVEKSVPAMLLYLGCLWHGAVYMPLNSGYTASEVAWFIDNAEPSLLIVDPLWRDRLDNLPDSLRIETLDGSGKGSWTDLLAHVTTTSKAPPRHDPEAPAAMLYTSGTTGKPKGAVIPRRALSSNAAILVDAWRFTKDDVLIHALPIFHVHGLFIATNTLISAGGSMIFLPKFDAAEVLHLFPRATSLMGVPTFYTRLLTLPGLTPDAVKGMRMFISGSAPLLAETHRAFADKTGHCILERYGMTETQMNTSNPYEGTREPGTVGFPLPGVDLRITDPASGSPLPQGEIGMIEVRGPNLFSGYWRNPEKTAEDMRDDGFFITGDLGMIDDKKYVRIIGRGKDLIISGGFNIYPKEIESEIDDLPGVNESAVIGVPHPDFGEAVVAVIVPLAGVELTEADIITGLQDRLARFKQPKSVQFVPELPRNTMGKVQKNALRDQYRGLFA